jgi:hypothetical protein
MFISICDADSILLASGSKNFKNVEKEARVFFSQKTKAVVKEKVIIKKKPCD